MKRILWAWAIATLVAFTGIAPAHADCPAAPVQTPSDLLISFLTANKTQISPANKFTAATKKGMVVFDGAANVLKFCDGTSWQTVGTGAGGGSALGAYSGKAVNTIYQATTDGLVIAYISTNLNGRCYVNGYTDSSATPTTLRATSWGEEISGVDRVSRNTFTMPVRSGDYWQVGYVAETGTCGSAVTWIPLSGGGGGGGSTTLAGLTDVQISTPTSGQSLVFNGTKWVPSTVSAPGLEVSFRGATGSYTIPDNVETSVSPLSQVFDVGGDNFNPTTGEFTAPAAGRYLFTGVTTLTSNTIQSVNFYSGFKVNGVTQTYGSRGQAGTYQYYPISSASAIYNLNAGDKVTLMAFTSPSAPITAHFSGFLIGGGGGGGGSTTLAGLTDVSTTGIANGKALVYNSTSSKWEPQTITAGGTQVAFSVGKAGANQSMTAADTDNLVTWPSEDYDTNNNFAANRFTATVAGKYLFVFKAYCRAAGNVGACGLYLRKNGTTDASTIGYGNGISNNYANPAQGIVTAIVDMNVGDWVQTYANVHALVGDGIDIFGQAGYTYFQGYLLSGGGGGGGSTTLAGLTDVTIGTPTNGQSLVYNSTTSKWVPTTVTTTGTQVAFWVDKNATAQTIASGSSVKLTWPREVYDTNSNFSGDRFTPQVAGKYIVHLSVRCPSQTGFCYAIIAKNGAAPGATISENFVQNPTAAVSIAQTTVVVDMNGSTDYLEAYTYSSGTTIDGMIANTYWTGSLLGGGGGGGSSTLAGLTDTQISSPTNGQSLVFNGTKWVPTTLTLSGSDISFATTGATTASTNGGVRAIFPTQTFDNGGDNYNPSTGIFTAPSAGTYYFSAGTFFDNLTTNSSGGVEIKTGANNYICTAYIPAYTGQYTAPSCGGAVTLAAGDTVSVYGYQNTGTPKALYGGTSNYFTGFKINGGAGGGSSTLAGLTDVTIGTPTNGQSLVYNSTTSKWVPTTISGGGASIYFNASAGTGQALNHGANTTIIPGTQVSDAGGDNYNPATGVFTAPSAGFYQFNGTVRTTGREEADDYIIYTIANTSTSTTICQNIETTGPVGYGFGPGCSGSIYLTAGQTVAANVYLWDVSDGIAVQSATFSGFAGGGGGGGGATALSGLTDVSTSGLASGKALVYNGTQWAPTTITTGGAATSGMAYRNASFAFSQVATWQDIPLTSGDGSLVNVTHSTSTNPARMTVANAGTYLVTYQTNNVYSTTDSTNYARLAVNGTPVTGTIISSSVGGNGYQSTISGSAVLTLNANDYVTVQGMNNLDGTIAGAVLNIASMGSGSGGGVTSLSALTDVTVGTPTNGQSLVYNSSTSKWVPTTVAGGSTQVSFMANRTTDQTIPTGSYQKVFFPNEVFDTNNNYDPSTSKFTPTVAGKYIVTLSVWCSNVPYSTGECDAVIGKTGALVAQNWAYPGTIAQVTTIVDMNGTTDYLEGNAFAGGGGTLIGGSGGRTYFTASLLAGGGGGGGATALAGLTDVSTTGIANGKALVYNSTSSKWEPGTVSSTLATLGDVTIGTPTNGQALVYNSGTGKWGPGLPTTAGAGFAAATSGSTSLSSGSTILGGYTKTFDTANNLNASTGVFTASVAGTYIFHGLVHANVGSSSDIYAGLLKNGSLIFYGSRFATVAGTNNMSTVSGVMTLAVGDTVSLSANLGSAGSQAFWQFNGALVGGGGGGGGSSQWTDISGGINYSAGKVGIGTTTPGSELDIMTTGSTFLRGSMVTQISADNGGAIYNMRKARGSVGSPATVANQDYVGGLQFVPYGSSWNLRAAVGAIVNGTVSGNTIPTDLMFLTGSTSADERMRITSSGNVNIGAITNLFKLAVTGANVAADPGNGATGIFAITTGTGINTDPKLEFGVYDTGTTGYSWLQALNTNSGFRDIVLNPTGGKVGIGTTAPAGKLEIVNAAGGNTASNYLQLTGSVADNTNYPGISFKGGTLATSYPKILINNGGYGLYLGGGTSGGVTNAAGMTFDSAAGTSFSFGSTTAMTILPGGNVGIGTPAPSGNLDVFGSDMNTAINIIGNSATAARNPRLNIYNYMTTPGGGAVLEFHTARGSQAAPLATQPGDGLGNVDFDGHNGAAFIDGASIIGVATETWTNSSGAALSNGAALAFKTTSNGTANYTERMRLDHNGNLGIGNTAPSQKLEVTGNVLAASFLYSSDKRLKEEIAPLTGMLDKIAALEPVSFVYTADANRERHLGLIAQDVQKIFPDVVHANSNGMLSIDYPGLIAPMIGAIKDLKAENAALKAEVDALKAQNADILKRLEALESVTKH